MYSPRLGHSFTTYSPAQDLDGGYKEGHREGEKHGRRMYRLIVEHPDTKINTKIISFAVHYGSSLH